jgi:hypothetical protein
MSEIIFDMRRIGELDEVTILNYVEVSGKSVQHIDVFEDFDNTSLKRLEEMIIHLTENIIADRILRSSFRDFNDISLNNVTGFNYYG